MLELKVNMEDKTSYLYEISKRIKCSIKSLKIYIESVNSYEDRYPEGKFTLKYKTTKKEEIIAQFSLVNMAGCCGIVISTGSFVTVPYRNKGIGTILNAMRQQIAFQWHYGLIVCTDKENNKGQQKVLDKNSWIKNLSFKNPRTNNHILVHSKKLVATKTSLGFAFGNHYDDLKKKKKKDVIP